MNLSNFGEQFASKVLEKTYQKSIYQGIVNREYEGEIRKPGDRVNIISFLNSILLNDYVVGTDMASEAIIDAEDQLIVEKRKYYNFSLDALEDMFTYGGDIPEHLLNDSAMVLERLTDAYVLDKFGSEVKAGSWIGSNLVVNGAANTMASLVTSATGATVNLEFANTVVSAQADGAAVEQGDGTILFGGFETSDLYKGFRLRSTSAFVSPWYRISGVTSSSAATLTEWDEAVSGSDFEEGYTLRGLFGGDGRNFPKYGTGDASFAGMTGLGWEIQAAVATSVSSASVYNQITLLSEALNDCEVSAESRHFTVPPAVVTQLKQSSQMQPTGVAEIYSGTVLNGRVMRVGAFDVHEAAGSRVSTRVSHSSATGAGADTVVTAGVVGYIMAANHIGFITYADKWSQSRVVEAENQFAKKYQGLYLFGAKVPRYRRKYGAILFGSV